MVGGWGVPKGPKCETAHESGPKCESRQGARRANRLQISGSRRHGTHQNIQMSMICFYGTTAFTIFAPPADFSLASIAPQERPKSGISAPQGRKSRSHGDLANIPVCWGGGGSQKVPNVKSDTVAVPNVKHPLCLVRMSGKSDLAALESEFYEL